MEELRQLGVRVAEEPTRDIMTFGIGYSTDIHGILEACRGEVLSRGGEILDPDGRPVPRLLAAGADIGGLSNYGYAGGLAPGYITGRWAGRTAARTKTLHPHHEQRKHP